MESMAQHRHSIHREKVKQKHLITGLERSEGYERRVGSKKSGTYEGEIHFDKPLAMDRRLVLRFIQSTQPEAWEKLEQHYTASVEEVFFEQLKTALKDRGLQNMFHHECNGLEKCLLDSNLK